MDTDDVDRVVDVREIDGPPLDDIERALDALEPTDSLCLLAPFEPVPLYDILEARGFTYDPEQLEPDLYRVLIEED